MKMWLEVNNIIKTLAKVARRAETAGETSEKKYVEVKNRKVE